MKSSSKSSWITNLLDWYSNDQRQMPWRTSPSPYRVWVSEIMLQQTQVVTVIPYFNRFIREFPTVFDLANADLQSILKLWEGLGYYSRARNIHKAAKQVCSQYNGILPDTYDELQTLPGIGPYVAAAIVSIAFDKPVPVVDGNVLRVFCRFWGITDDIRQPSVRKHLFTQLTPIIKQVSSPSDFNQSIMEIGALICSPKSPKCGFCPISKTCYAQINQLQSQLPYKSKTKPVPHYTVSVGLIFKKNKILIGKRKESQMLGGLWELPGGKQTENETVEQAVIREIYEETGITASISSKIGVIKHAYTHFKITLHAFMCIYIAGFPKPHSTQALRWVSLSELDQFPFPKATIKVFNLFQQFKSNPKTLT